jgi:head-tail adaptor
VPTGWSKPERSQGAPALRHRVAFDKRGAPSGGTDYGQSQGTWAEQFVVAAAIEARFGGEQISAQRLAGRQPFTITVRYSPATLQIAPDWRARDARTGKSYDVTSIADPDDSRRWLDILALQRSEE